MDIVGNFEAATSAEPAFTDALRGAVLHHYRGDPEVIQCFQSTVTRTMTGDGGGQLDVEGMDYPSCQERRQRNAAQAREAAEAGASVTGPGELNEMVDLAARRIFGSGLSEDRILLETGEKRVDSLPILRDFATNRPKRSEGPGDAVAEEIFRAVANRDPKEVVKNYQSLQNLSSSRPWEQKVPREQRSAQRELMNFLERASRVKETLPSTEGSRSSGIDTDEEPPLDSDQPDPLPSVTKRKIAVASMRKLFHQAREEGVLSLRRLGQYGELEGLFRSAALDAIEEAVQTEGPDRTGAYLQLIDSISMPGPVVRSAIDEAMASGGGTADRERAEQLTDLDRMVDEERESDLRAAFRAAAQQNPRAALLEAAETMEASTPESRAGALSWPVGEAGHPKQHCKMALRGATMT